MGHHYHVSLQLNFNLTTLTEGREGEGQYLAAGALNGGDSCKTQ